jgi:hypothetical protein
MSTFLTLFVVPCTYLIVHALGDRVKLLLLGDTSTATTAIPTGEPSERGS